MKHNQESAETLMAICAEAPWFFEIDPESGDPMGNCVYSKLIQLVYAITSLASADGKDGQSINYLYHLVCPGAEEGVVDKMHP